MNFSIFLHNHFLFLHLGQGGSGSLRALTQKQQLQIMNDFRSGKSNILIATSIGEEGIDVGEVDLIVCFDISTSNPTRFVQRIGRTGRKKSGNVVMLVTEGKEQQILKEVLNNKDQTNKKILTSSVVRHALYRNDPRLVPTEFKPQCLQTFIAPHNDDDNSGEEDESKLKKATASKKPGQKRRVSEKGNQDLRKFFNKKPAPVLDDEDLEYFEIDTKMTQARPGLLTQKKMEESFDQMKHLFKDLQSPQPTQVKPKTSGIDKQNTLKKVPKIEIESIDLCNADSSEEKIENLSPIKHQLDFKIKEEANPQKRQKLQTQASQGSIMNYFKDVTEANHIEELSSQDSVFCEKLKNFLETNITKGDVLKRAAINDLSYHLKSEDMSDDMKYILLTGHVNFIKENLEQVKVLSALQDFADGETAEEKSIKEVHKIIVNIFGDLEKVEKFLQDVEMGIFKEESEEMSFSSDEEDIEDERIFKNKMDQIFGDLGEPLKSCETFDWCQEKYKQTERYKEAEKTKQQQQQHLHTTINSIQESMVYNTFVDAEDEEEILNNGNDVSFTESKYCSQWLEFSKPNIAFKSTPLQGASTKVRNHRGTASKRSSLLTKLEEAHEEEPMHEDNVEMENDVNASQLNNNNNNNSKFLDSLLRCEKELNTLLLERKREEEDKTKSDQIMIAEDEDTSSRDTNITTGSLILPESEFPLASKPNVPDILSSTIMNPNESSFADHMQDDEENEMFLAAMEAEIRFTQTKEEEKKATSSSSDVNKTSSDLDVTKETNSVSLDKLNSSVKMTPPSLNSTPDILDFKKSVEQPKVTTSSLPTPPEISIQHELDLDMDAFMEPFPEEQELLKTSYLPPRRESLKENFSKESLTRQSPDLFAEDQKSPNLLQVNPVKKPSLASKLSAKLGLQRCQSSFNPTTTTSATFKSPTKNVFSSKSSVHLTSPSSRPTTDNKKNEKSPSLFDMYLKNGKGRVKLPSSLRNTSSCLGISTTSNNVSKNSPGIPLTQDESIVAVRKRTNAPKRKIFDSDSETHESENDVTAIVADNNEDDDSDFEQVAATQAVRFMHVLKVEI